VRIAGVQVGKVQRHGAMRTAFGKSPVAGPVGLRESLDGDAQADHRYHGGPERAVLAYSADHYPLWRAELAWPELPLGGFGENLSVEGVNEDTACIGDVWRAGTALLQIASRREPCRKISEFWGRPDLLRHVVQTGRTGWYMRVLEEGILEAGAEIALVTRGSESVPMRDGGTKPGT
jgi:MOSC domain-containing protein YiiM